MKKKLLTVLLAVVMVFGVFGLTACGGSNPDSDYNYYGVKYSIEDEVKIEAVTFQAVYKMFTTKGNFLLYVDSGATAANYQAINKLANDWDVTIYHFNPDLTGGYAKNATAAQNANICSDLTGIAAGSQVKAVQDLLLACSKTKDVATLKSYDGKLLAIAGAESTASADGVLTYNGKVSAANTVADGAKSIAAIAIKNPSYGAYTSEAKDVPYIPAAYNTGMIGTMNLFADARLHIYDDRDAITEEKTDVFVTVANYEMFAHLLDKNEGYFAVFFGGTWCPNTQAILYHVNYLAKDYGIEKVYFFDPRLDDGVRLDQVASETTFSSEKYFEDSLKIQVAVEKGEYAYGSEDYLAAMAKAGYTTTYSVVENKANITGNLNSRNTDWAGLSNSDKYKNALSMVTGLGTYMFSGTEAELLADATEALEDADKTMADVEAWYYNYSYAYASFLDNYIPTYWSEWNISTKLNIGGKNYTKMCVPNIMMFNGEKENAKAELVALAEAEYVWADTSVEGNPYRIAWENAVKEVFDANPYAEYLPIVAAPEASTESSSTSSAPAASAPAADAGGC